MGASAATRIKRSLRAAQPGAIPAPAPEADFERHQRKCAICHHAERETMEELFIYWHSAQSITDLFELPDWSTIYRHARAAGLYERRRHNIRAVLDHLLEGVDSVQSTPMGIVSALRAYACLSDSGGWVEPTKRLLLTTARVPSAPAPPAEPLASPAPLTPDATPPPAAAPLPPPASPPDFAAPGSKQTQSPSESQRSQNPAPSHTSNIEPSAPAVSRPAGPASPPTSGLRPPNSSSSNRQSPELEPRVSRLIQRIESLSNRQIRPPAQRELPLAQKGSAKVPKR